MSCSFISAFRDLSNLSCGAVANIDHFSELNKYLHVIRTPEEVLRALLLRIKNASQKKLVLVCGSAGDGKSHLLSYLRNCYNHPIFRNHHPDQLAHVNTQVRPSSSKKIMTH